MAILGCVGLCAPNSTEARVLLCNTLATVRCQLQSNDNHISKDSSRDHLAIDGFGRKNAPRRRAPIQPGIGSLWVLQLGTMYSLIFAVTRAADKKAPPHTKTKGNWDSITRMQYSGEKVTKEAAAFAARWSARPPRVVSGEKAKRFERSAVIMWLGAILSLTTLAYAQSPNAMGDPFSHCKV
jgi:hypothetical protein